MIAHIIFHSIILSTTIATYKRLIQARADVNLSDYDNYTPLIAASRHGHYGVVKLLLENGVHVNTQTHSGSTALFQATAKRHYYMIDDESQQYIYSECDCKNCSNPGKKENYVAAVKSEHIEWGKKRKAQMDICQMVLKKLGFYEIDTDELNYAEDNICHFVMHKLGSVDEDWI